ncbi:MAG: hypothetical protein ACYC1L_09715 [Alphaproteobacteria bacterium]
MTLVSFNLASNRPEQLAGLLANLHETAGDPTCFEVLVLIDEGDAATAQTIARARTRRPFPIKTLAVPPAGYFNLWRGLNRLHRELCDPGAYFVCNINDEIRFTSRDWDAVLRRWVGFFPDEIFRLRISKHKLRNYGDFWECGYAPENYAFFTKRWIDVAGGDWNACHGPDSFQQFIAYYLAWAYYPAKSTYCRDIPLFDIAIEGEGAFKGLDEKQFWERMRQGWTAWYRLVGHRMQTECSRRARRLQTHIVARALGYEDFTIVDDRARGEIAALDPQGRPLLDRTGKPLCFNYRLSWLKITLTNLLRRPMQNYWCGGGPAVLRETILHIPFNMFPFLRPLIKPLRPVWKPVLWGVERSVGLGRRLRDSVSSLLRRYTP